MFQLLSTVTYCHAMNIMHRDIKPEHILIEKKSKDGFYYIKLIDFGTAKVFINLQHQLVGSIHTMAPEVIAGKYNEKCDLWSCGIILYVLFKGEYPFTGNNQNELISNISNGYIDLSSPPFDTVSPEAKDLIQKMIKVDMKTRISASKALEHSWFKKLHIKDSFFELDIEKAKTLLNNIYNYAPSNNLQKPVIAYLVHNYGDKSFLVKAANNLFRKIDINNNGTLDRNEFIKHCGDYYKKNNQPVDAEYLGTLFDKIDTDKSNQIGYREFICAAVDKKEFLEEEMLKDAFNFFDKDNNKKITIEEVMKAFGTMKGYNQKDFENILALIDINKDKYIDYEELKTMMIRIIE